MIGRNDPCPCGSGKKHKKCCLGKNEVSVEQLVDKELERILLSIYEQAPGQADMIELNSYRRQWAGKLGSVWDENSIEGSLSEYFLFVARRDLWKRHLVKVLNTPIRSAVRAVVKTWQEPFVLFGKVKSIEGGFLEVEEILGSKTYYLEQEEYMPTEKGAIVFGGVLPDNRKHKNGVYIITSLMFVKDDKGRFESEIAALAESSGFESSLDFYKEHMIDIFYLMLNRENDPVEELNQSDLTEIQQETLAILKDKLEEIGFQSDIQELLKNITISYFLKEKPNFRKPSIIAAAVFQVANNLEMLGEYSSTNAEIAKLFEVSTGSMTKHADNISGFVSKVTDEMKEKE